MNKNDEFYQKPKKKKLNLRVPRFIFTWLELIFYCLIIYIAVDIVFDRKLQDLKLRPQTCLLGPCTKDDFSVSEDAPSHFEKMDKKEMKTPPPFVETPIDNFKKLPGEL